MPFEKTTEDQGRPGAYEVTTSRSFRALDDLRDEALTAKRAYIRHRQAYIEACRAAEAPVDVTGLPSIA